MELRLIISGEYSEILEALKRLGHPGGSEKTEAPPAVETNGRKCACGCGNIATGKRGWNYHYYSIKCYRSSLQEHVPAPREFSIPEGQDMGPVGDKDRNLKRKLDKIKVTCPTPTKRPDIHREFL